jgi:LPXTG-motif cell wall-anchored protein
VGGPEGGGGGPKSDPAGTAIGIIVALGIVGAAGFLLYRRRKQRQLRGLMNKGTSPYAGGGGVAGDDGGHARPAGSASAMEAGAAASPVRVQYAATGIGMVATPNPALLAMSQQQ